MDTEQQDSTVGRYSVLEPPDFIFIFIAFSPLHQPPIMHIHKPTLFGIRDTRSLVIVRCNSEFTLKVVIILITMTMIIIRHPFKGDAV